jgi:hypothetical protein
MQDPRKQLVASGYDADANRFAVRNAGLELLADEVAEVGEPEGNVRFLWVLARKTSDTGS